MRQELMFTACPRDRTKAGLRLSVFISPRLDPQADDHLLGTFPDFLDWPAVVAGMSWGVRVGGTPFPATVASAAPSSQLWGGLFNPQTLVRPPEFPEYAKHLWFSYPAGNLVDFVENLYQTVATTFPTEFPHVNDLAGTGIPDLAHLGPDGRDRRHVLRRQLEDQLRNVRALPPAPLDTEWDSFQLWNFHQPGTMAFGVEPPEFDFHEVVATCSDQFGLMRRLGLVVDLVVPGTFPTGATEAQVEVAWTPPTGDDSVDIRPITRSIIGAESFRASNRTPVEIVDGQLPLDGPNYRLVQVDVDGAVLNLITLARNLYQAAQHTSLDTPDHEALPALRSAGLSVIRTGHAQQLVRQVDAGGELHAARTAGQDIVLHAEDLWRGTRFDVLDGRTGRWHSLQKREGDYTFLGIPATESVSEEGAIAETPSSRDDDDGAQDQFLHLQESLAKWEGWSLAAPRPGRTLLNQDQVGAAPNDPPDEFPLAMDFAATPGSLPALRFGVRYRVRARAVDLAGNSLRPDITDTSHATERTTYLRYEPVPAPYVLPRHPRQPGDSVERVVLRSNFDTDPEQPTERHIAPPRTAQRTAEEHGLYDDDDGVPDAAAYAAIVAREAQSFADPGYGGGISQTDPNAYDQPYFPTAPLPVLYLPDLLARGVAFHRESDDELLVSFEHGDGWPEALPVRLVVEEGNGLLGIDELAGERVVRVGLPKAETLRVPYSCYVDEGALDVSAIWRLMETAPGVTPAQLDQWRDDARHGRLWMITPSRTLTLVHAVRQPLLPPELVNPGVHRSAGNTFAVVAGTVTYSEKSTSRVDLRTTWTDPVDRGTGQGAPAPDPFDQDRELWIAVPHGTPEGHEDALALGVRHEFGDTKHHVVTYRAVATSKFSEYFEEGPFTRDSEEVTLDVPSSARPPAPKVLYAIPTHRWSFGAGGLSLSSSGEGGGLRVYLDRPFFQSGVGELLGVLLAPDPSKIPDPLAPYVTRWGFDPIRASGPLPGPAPLAQHFPLAAEVSTDRVLDENGLSVHVAGHAVSFDSDRGLWYCDIKVDSGEADWPFIRLALASYQPSSVDNLHLSRVVLADFVQLTPDRSATVGLTSPESRDLRITFVAAVPEPDDTPPVSVTARLERHLPGAVDELLGWEQVVGERTEIELQPVAVRGETRWQGTLRLPPRGQPGHAELRVVLEEWRPLPAGPTEDEHRFEDREHRLVFRDIIPLDPIREGEAR